MTKVKSCTESVFCSELVVFYYQQAGWMSKEQLPWKFLPKDFADYRSANVPYYLQPGISLGPMIVLDPHLASQGAAESPSSREENPVAAGNNNSSDGGIGESVVKESNLHAKNNGHPSTNVSNTTTADSSDLALPRTSFDEIGEHPHWTGPQKPKIVSPG